MRNTFPTRTTRTPLGSISIRVLFLIHTLHYTQHKENVSATVDPEVAEYLDQDHINKSATINKAMKMYMAAGEGEMAALRVRRDNLRSTVRKQRNNLEDDKAELERVESRLAELQEQKQGSEKQAIEDAVANVTVSRLSSGTVTIDTPEPMLETLADRAGVTVDELKAEAKKRVEGGDE